MEDALQSVAFILSIIALTSVLLLVFVNLYLKIRRRFPVKVNCWFCNQWTKVHYDNQNSFECPSCLQYNGFTLDGDYNASIPGQHDELLNRHTLHAQKKKWKLNDKHLCHFCSNNQQLKIYQLANYSPLNESNYDAEIEHFQEQLEKAYKLCPPCEAVVKSTINQQNWQLGLSVSKLRKKGLKLLDLDSSHDGISKQKKQLFLKQAVCATLVGFAALNLTLVLIRMDFYNKYLTQLVPRSIAPYTALPRKCYLLMLNACRNFGEHLLSTATVQDTLTAVLQLPFIETIALYFSDAKQYVFGYVDQFSAQPSLPKTNNAVFLCFGGVLFEFIQLFWDTRDGLFQKTLRFMMWTIMFCLHWIQPLQDRTNLHENVMQVVASIAIMISMVFPTKVPKVIKAKKLKRKAAQRPPTMCSTFNEEFSDNEVEEKKKAPTPHKNQVRKSSSPHSHNSFQDFRPSSAIIGNLDKPFHTAKSHHSGHTSLSDTTSLFSSSVINHDVFASAIKDSDIDLSLNQLNLGTSPVTKRLSPLNKVFVNSVPRPRPVLSPPKLRNVTQNSWVAGGFWRDSNGILLPPGNCSNLSRSSSQTSGIGSLGPNHSPLNNSFYGDYDNHSVFSEPAFSMMAGRNAGLGLGSHSEAQRAYFPVLNHEQLVYIAPLSFHRLPEFNNGLFMERNTTNMEKPLFSPTRRITEGLD